LVACAARPTTFRRRSIDQSFHDYADYALSAEFASGLNRLVSLGRRGRYAVMCSETLWWRCRRWIIADYLISHGVFSTRRHWPPPLSPSWYRPRGGRKIDLSGTPGFPSARSR
jgi:hypothetical protein